MPGANGNDGVMVVELSNTARTLYRGTEKGGFACALLHVLHFCMYALLPPINLARFGSGAIGHITHRRHQHTQKQHIFTYILYYILDKNAHAQKRTHLSNDRTSSRFLLWRIVTYDILNARGFVVVSLMCR